MAEATFYSEGFSIDYTPTGAVAAGEVVLQGDLIGVAHEAIAANVKGSLMVAGVVTVAKSTSEAMATVGTAVYWNAGANQVTATPSTHKLFGKTVAVAAQTAATVQVLLTNALTPA